jgi:hypothetical protein
MNGLELARARLTEDGEPALPFERWREMAPRLAGRELDDREVLLGAAGVEKAAWERADGYWSLTLAAECARGERGRAEDFGRACAEELAARREGTSPKADDTLPEGIAPPQLAAVRAAPEAIVTSTAGLAARASPDAGAVPSWESTPEPPSLVVRPEVVVPTFLRAGSTGEAPASGAFPPPLAPPAPFAAPAPLASFVPASIAFRPALVVAGASSAEPGRATVEMAPFAPAAGRAATPFTAAPAGVSVSVPPRRAALPRQSGVTVDLSSALRQGLAGEAVPQPGPPPAAVRSTPGPLSARRDPGATVALDPETLAQALADHRRR